MAKGPTPPKGLVLCKYAKVIAWDMPIACIAPGSLCPKDSGTDSKGNDYCYSYSLKED